MGDPHGYFEMPDEPAGSSAAAQSRDHLATEPPSRSPSDPRLVEARRRLEELPADGSLRVVFQPIVDLATTKVIGYEALARFPGDSSITPRTWFAEAAEVGLLLDIEMTAIRAALAQLEDHRQQGQQEEPDRHQSDGVDRHGVLEGEQHRSADGDYEEVSDAVGALRDVGVRIALDDTGSGTVSFSSLFDVHADIIKIDIDVTHGIASDPIKEAMASALKSLADRLGAMSLAEGIETEEEFKALREVGVQAGQGYLFGRPEPVEE